MSKHAEKLGTKFIYDEVVKTDFSKNVKEVYLSSGTVLKSKTVIIATGAKARYLGLESESLNIRARAYLPVQPVMVFSLEVKKLLL